MSKTGSVLLAQELKKITAGENISRVGQLRFPT